MSFGRIYAIVLRQYYLLRGSFARVFPIFSWIAVDMVLWGFLTRYLNNVSSSGFNFVPILLGAVLLWDFCTRVMQGVTMTFFEDAWSRNFLNIFASPLLVSEYVSGLVISSILTSIVGVAAMLIIAVPFFKLSLVIYGIMIIPFIFILFLFGISLGIVGSALVLRFGPPVEWFIWLIPAFLSPFAAVLYPLSMLPPWMRCIAYCIPPSYVFEGLRGIVGGGTINVAGLIWGGCLAIMYIFLAYWFFVKIYKHALKTGLIARYSAESLS